MRENDRISPQPGQAGPLLSLRLWVSLRPMTRAHVTLLGPCFKTGQVDSLPLHHRLLALNGTTSRRLRHTAQNNRGQLITLENQTPAVNHKLANELPAFPAIQSHKCSISPV
ncbi:hypothetical protein AHF37_05765 [Paragonimus kellicotti]|nr:hypothetical protein AHF37_07499 [Paragonimus kellicotti]KAF6774930.1 hypothetical protein AHF37_05765 [Paragonimus kellicotti]